MKEIIVYNNWAWAKYFPGTDFSQKVIYDVVSNMCTAENNNLERTEDGYTWITLNLILNEAPMIPINTRSGMSKIVGELEKKGILLTRRIGKGKKYFKVSDWALKNLAIMSDEEIAELEKIEGKNYAI
jgi:Cdc6-like AAA superfamily ATPase